LWESFIDTIDADPNIEDLMPVWFIIAYGRKKYYGGLDGGRGNPF
jgi:hypothetical protein